MNTFLSRRQLGLLVFVTLIWGVNWPVLKLGVQGFPPLSFRAISLLLALPVLWLALRVQGLPIRIERAHWKAVLWLGLFNLALWSALMILAMPMLASGRAAILGYTMPIFSAMLGAVLYQDRLDWRGWLGIGAAGGGVLLLLWNEIGSMSGRPAGVFMMLLGAVTWAYGTQKLRRNPLPMATLTLSFWMVFEAAILLGIMGVLVESAQWRRPSGAAVWATVFNALLALSFANAAWLSLARNLPPLASTLSVMMIPVIGVFSGALWLGETLQWQDWSAMALMSLAIASVLRPGPSPEPQPPP